MRRRQYIIKRTYHRPDSHEIFWDKFPTLLVGSVDSSNNVSGVVKDGDDVVPGGNFGTGDEDEGSGIAE